MVDEEPMYAFNRMRQLLAEITFLTELIEDEQFEQNQQVLVVIMEDFTALVELAMARGLVAEEEEIDPNDPRAAARLAEMYGEEEGYPDELDDLDDLEERLR